MLCTLSLIIVAADDSDRSPPHKGETFLIKILVNGLMEEDCLAKSVKDLIELDHIPQLPHEFVSSKPADTSPTEEVAVKVAPFGSQPDDASSEAVEKLSTEIEPNPEGVSKTVAEEKSDPSKSNKLTILAIVRQLFAYMTETTCQRLLGKTDGLLNAKNDLPEDTVMSLLSRFQRLLLVHWIQFDQTGSIQPGRF